MILGEDATEAFNFILLDRAAKRMFSTTATKMIADMLKVYFSYTYQIHVQLQLSKDLSN